MGVGSLVGVPSPTKSLHGQRPWGKLPHDCDATLSVMNFCLDRPPNPILARAQKSNSVKGVKWGRALHTPRGPKVAVATTRVRQLQEERLRPPALAWAVVLREEGGGFGRQRFA